MSCDDNEFVTVAFQIVNLGSFDAGEQAGAVLDIAQKGAEAFARVYLEAVQFVVASSGLPLATVFADGIDELTPVIVDSVGAAFEDIIIPLISDLANFISGIFGHPNCNGDVLHDVGVFKPLQPWPPQSFSKVYTASEKTGCGSPAKTAVTYTLERWHEPVPLFGSGSPPKIEASPGTGISGDAWLGVWVEDPFTSTPRIRVSITRSIAASGTYALEILENVDTRFDAKFEADRDVITPSEATLPPVGDDVFATVRPWTVQPFVPLKLKAYLASVGPPPDGGAAASPLIRNTSLNQMLYTAQDGKLSPVSVPQAEIRFTREWGAPVNPPPAEDIGVTGVITRVGPKLTLFGYEDGPIFDLQEKFGVWLGLYAFKYDNQIVGYGVRYMRDQNWSFTRADAMLSKWSPLG